MDQKIDEGKGIKKETSDTILRIVSKGLKAPLLSVSGRLMEPAD
jgi:hypothetical protein